MEEKELYNEKFKNILCRIENHEDRISDSENKLVDMNVSFQVSFAKTSAALEKLSDLPVAIASMQNTNEEVRLSLTQLGNQVDNLEGGVKRLDDKVCGLSNKVEVIDEEGKHNIRKYIRDNWPIILVGISILASIGISEILK